MAAVDIAATLDFLASCPPHDPGPNAPARDFVRAAWRRAVLDSELTRMVVAGFAREVNAYYEHSERLAAAENKVAAIVEANPGALPLVEEALERLYAEQVVL